MLQKLHFDPFMFPGISIVPRRPIRHARGPGVRALRRRLADLQLHPPDHLLRGRHGPGRQEDSR